MNYKTIFIEIIVLAMFWVIEKLWFQISRGNRPQRVRVHNLASWMILLFIMTWWRLGNYYIAFPLALIMLIGIILAVWQWGRKHEFLYRSYWQKFWLYNSAVIIISFLFANIFTKLPTP